MDTFLIHFLSLSLTLNLHYYCCYSDQTILLSVLTVYLNCSTHQGHEVKVLTHSAWGLIRFAPLDLHPLTFFNTCSLGSESCLRKVQVFVWTCVAAIITCVVPKGYNSWPWHLLAQNSQELNFFLWCLGTRGLSAIGNCLSTANQDSRADNIRFLCLQDMGF